MDQIVADFDLWSNVVRVRSIGLRCLICWGMASTIFCQDVGEAYFVLQDGYPVAERFPCSLMLTVHLWPVGRLSRKRWNRWDCFVRWMPWIWRMPRLCFGKSVGQVCGA